MGPTGHPETSARNYHHTLRNIANEGTSLLLGGGGLNHATSTYVTNLKEVRFIRLRTNPAKLSGRAIFVLN
jgi:hypothetical protein